tara:strand:+ start:16812 stop:17285 length:474 start_codon:yes stop_codon:yes gene_type:complete
MSNSMTEDDFWDLWETQGSQRAYEVLEVVGGRFYGGRFYSEGEEEMTNKTKTKEKFNQRLASFVEWFVDHGGDVDGTAFNDACSELFGLARDCVGRGNPVPLVVQKSQGMFLLDAACALMGRHVPQELLQVDCLRVERYLNAGRHDDDRVVGLVERK